MPCFIALVALLSPRLAIFLIYLFSDRMTIAFQSGWVAILGWLFLPWTTLAWAICYTPIFGIQGFGWFIVALGLFFDISTYAANAKARGARQANY